MEYRLYPGECCRKKKVNREIVLLRLQKMFMLNIFRFERFLKWNFPFKLNQQKEQIMNTKKYVNILLRVNALLNFSLFFFVIVPYSVLFATC